MHGDRARAGRVGRSDDQLHLDLALPGQHQGRLDGQFVETGASGLVTGADRQLGESGTGEEDRVAEGVVGEPSLAVDRYLAAEDEFARLGDLHGRTEQRVAGGLHAGRRAARRPDGRHVHVGPVAPAAEGVRRQLDLGRAPGGEDPGGLDTGSVGVELPGGEPRRRDLRRALALYRDDHGSVDRVGETARRHRGQGAFRAEVHVVGDALGLQAAHPVHEAHGTAAVGDPVVGVGQGVAVGERTRHRGDDLRTGGRERQLLGHVAQVVEEGLGQGRVPGGADGQHLRPAAQALPVFGDGPRLLGLARDDEGPGTVDGGDVGPVGERRADLVLRGLDADHHAARHVLDQLGAVRGELDRVVQREDAREVGSGDLAAGVAEQVVGAQLPEFQQPAERDGQRELRGLAEGDLPQQLGVDRIRFGEHHVPQRAVEVGVEARAHLVEGLRERREGGVQFTSHSGPLGAVPGEEERDPRSGLRGAGHHARGVLLGRERGERRELLLPGVADDGGPVGELGLPQCERVADVVGAEPGVLGEVLQQPPGLCGQGLGRSRGQQPGQYAVGCGPGLGAHGVLGGGRGRRLRLRPEAGSLLQDGVRVGAAVAEGGDARTPRPVRPGPGDGLGEQLDVARRPVHVRCRLVGEAAHRHFPVEHGLHHLDDAGDPGRRLGVPHVRLDRPQPQRPVVGAVLAVRGEQRVGLDGVAERGARPVALDGVDLVRPQSGDVERLADHPFLRGAVRRGGAVGRPVGVDRRAAHVGEDRVAVALGVGEAFEDDHADALAPADAVGGGGVRLAPPVRRDASAVLREGFERGEGGDAAGEREVAVTVAQRLTREVQGHEGRGARGVDGDGGALEAEDVRDPSGDHAAVPAGADVLAVLLQLAQRPRVVAAAAHHSREDAGGALLQRERVDARRLQRLPADLHEHPLFRGHHDRLVRADPEERGVEVRGVLDEASPWHGPGPGEQAVPVVQVPGPVGGQR
ncbi:hypothetical protein P376_5916 [Streptomyces sp. HCCB10043]|nr:hypothetical protein P376_5916 [Streptomyces sp. HCCB10043]